MSGESPGPGTETRTIPWKCDDADAEVSGKMDETANPRGCKLEIGKKEHSGISRLFLETHSRMSSLQESSGLFSPLVGGRKSLQEQKGAYVPHSYKLTFLYSFFYSFFYFGFFICSSAIPISWSTFPWLSFLYSLSHYFRFFIHFSVTLISFICLFLFALLLNQSLPVPSNVRDFILETGSTRQKFNSSQRT